MDWNVIWILVQVAILVAVITVIAWKKKRKYIHEKPIKPTQNSAKMQQIINMRARRLNEPLAETVRPVNFSDIIGQEEGIRALKAALCGPNPQHVLIFGPPGVGKTCAARLVLEDAKKKVHSPFTHESKFIEVDATCVRFDERAIADPLIGSVHDPIYQGAGSLGTQGVPQPKPGAVTKAHCGVLFLDEIGELHPMQMNKLLKVLEDRNVKLESAYYSSDNSNIPQHIHDIFENGLPADFRLVGATTRRPEDIPPALRSRCLELYFKELTREELEKIAIGAAKKAGYALTEDAAKMVSLHAHSGRDAVNIIQLCSGIAYDSNRREIEKCDVAWVCRTCKYTPRIEQHMPLCPSVGHANGLAVAGASGLIIEIECMVQRNAEQKRGNLILNGVVSEEEIDLQGRRLKRKSMALGSVENVLASFANGLKFSLDPFDIRFNIPGAMPVDGPSAGVAIAIALYSALTNKPSDHLLCATGEITIGGEVRPVGGVREKIAAAKSAGAMKVLIPSANWEADFENMGVQVIAVSTLREALRVAFSNVLAKQVPSMPSAGNTRDEQVASLTHT